MLKWRPYYFFFLGLILLMWIQVGHNVVGKPKANFLYGEENPQVFETVFSHQDFLDEGRSFKLKDFSEKIIIVSFWAHWCAPCMQELPFLNTLEKKFKEKLKIIAFNSDDSEKTIKTITGKYKLSFKTYRDEQKVAASLFEVKALPYVIIYKNGKLEKRFFGKINTSLEKEKSFTVYLEKLINS